MSLAEVTMGHSKRPASRTPVLAFVCDDPTMDVVSRVVPGGRRGVEVCEGGVEAACRSLNAEQAPDLLLVDISESPAPMADLAKVREILPNDTTVIAIGNQNDVSLYRALVSAGVSEYLIKPLTSTDLRRALLTASNDAPAVQQDVGPRGRVMAVIGTRGGVGASTIAVNQAWLLANEHKQRTALVDLDMHFGTAALMLELEPGHGLRDVLSNPDRIDSLFVASALVHDGDNLYVLSSEEPVDDTVPIRGEGITYLLNELQQAFEMVVVDLPRYLMVEDTTALSVASAVVIVTDFTLPGLRDTVRIRNAVRKISPDIHIQIVVNRLGVNKRNELSQADFERNLEGSVDLVIPEDPKAAAIANGAKPLALTAKSSRTGAGLRQITGVAAGLEEGRRKHKLSLFGGREKKK